MHQLVTVRTKGFPYKLFLLLQPHSRNLVVAEEILQSRPCMQDELTKAIVREFNTPALLCGDRCVQLLACLALNITGATFCTERLHSKNKRRVAGVTQTNVKELQGISLMHAAWVGEPWMEEAPAPVKKKAGRPKRERPEAVGVDGKKRRKTGGGGGWRAFIHYMTKVEKRVCDFRGLQQLYLNLSEDERAWYRQMGLEGRCSNS